MPQNNQPTKSFADFTNLYDLNKTLRFSLVPVLTQEQENEIIKAKGYKNIEQITRQDKEEKFFNENKKEIFEVDIERKKQYRKLKYYLTELHKFFIKDALKSIKDENKIDFSELFENFKMSEKSKDENEKENYIKKINSNKLNIAKFFGDKNGSGGIFQEIAKNYYKFLKDSLKEKEKIAGGKAVEKFAIGKDNILLSQNVLRILEEKINDNSIKEKTKKDKNGQEIIDEEYSLKFKDINGKDTNLIDYFTGWTTYFKNFNEIRGNLYKDDGRKEENEDVSGEARIRKANAGQITTRIIDENFEIFVKNFIWAEKNRKILGLENYKEKDVEDNLSIFDTKFYVNCLTQEDIDKYNVKIADLNKFFNEAKADKKKKDKIKYLKTLYKQLLFTSNLEKENFVEEFLDNNDFAAGLEKFKTHSQEKIDLVKNFLSVDDFGNNLDDIFLDENQTHFFCNQFFGSWSYFRDLYRQQNQIKKTDNDNDKKEFKDKDNAEKKEFSLQEIKELLDSKDKNEFKNDAQKGNFGKDNKDIESIYDNVYKENLSNFENFILFIKYYFNSLLNGRAVFTRLENKDLGNFIQIVDGLEKARTGGEKIDELLLKKVSVKSFRRNIEEAIEDKKKKFEAVFENFKEFSKNKKRLNREGEFEFKKDVNEYCNRISEINRFFSLFFVPEGVDGNIINKMIKKFKENNEIVPLYNTIRNFITRRGDELEKIKLNFDNQSLLGGWAYKTTDYKCRVLTKNNKYYLLLIGDKQDRGASLQQLKDYKIMDYYQQKGQTIFGSVYKGRFGDDYGSDRGSLVNKEFIKNIERIIDENLSKDFPRAERKLMMVKKMIRDGKFAFSISADEFSQLFIKKTDTNFLDYKNKKNIPKKEDIIIEILREKFGNIFDYENNKDYLLNRIKEVTKKDTTKNSFLGSDRLAYEIAKLEPYFYKNSFRNINIDEEDECLKGKKFFIFQIYNKDFSNHKKDSSNENMHTLYFKELFSDENLKEPIFKLSGGAEIFFRDKVEDYKMEQCDRKDLKNPKTDKVPFKKRRFTESKILFHLPIVLNNINDSENVNKKIHRYIQENDDVKILGIDRGEKELAYYCLLDKNGKICGDLKSMNETGSNIVKNREGVEIKQIINYQKKLDIKEKERMLARKSWTKIEGIKDLKKGYISNVIKDIAELMTNNNALVCLEELNYGFKRGRIRIEKSIYQNLENDLVNKLNYLVLEKSSQGVRKALQLTPRNNAQKYWGNQMGAIFYTDAKFTSRTCPNCGFRKRGVGDFDQVNNLKTKIENEDLKIFFEKKNDRFRIEYNWKYEFNENNQKKELNNSDLYGKNIMEVVYSDMQRAVWNNGRYTSETRNPNEELKKLFGDPPTSEKNLFKSIQERNRFSYSYFVQIFKSILEIRNTIDEKDIISCPKCHFSTLSDKMQKIKDGDANGAYNIARRGLLIFEKIRGNKLTKKTKTKKGIESKDLKITLKEWDEQTYQQWDKKDWLETENKRGL